MKKILFIAFIALWACGKKDKVTPQTTTTVPAPTDTVMICNLHGPGINKNVNIKLFISDANNFVHGSWDTTVLYEAEYTYLNPKVVVLDIPGMHNIGSDKAYIVISYPNLSGGTESTSIGPENISFYEPTYMTTNYPTLPNAIVFGYKPYGIIFPN